MKNLLYILFALSLPILVLLFLAFSGKNEVVVNPGVGAGLEDVDTDNQLDISRKITPLLKNGKTATVNVDLDDNSSVALTEDFYSILSSDKESAYDIYYFTLNKKVSVYLYEEPIGEARRKAEQELLSYFDVSEKDLCEFDIDVLTNIHVNTYYAGRNLGLSFCSDGVKLE